MTGISNALLQNDSYELVVCILDKTINNIAINQVEHNLISCFFPEKNDKAYSENLDSVFCNVLDELKPDLVHILGTEYPRTLSMVKAFLGKDVSCVISITRMVGPYSRKYYGSVPHSVDSNVIRNFFTMLTGMSSLKRGKNVIGRTTWDYACTKQIDENIVYHYCNETLRDAFYLSKWDYNKCVPHFYCYSSDWISDKRF